MTTAIMQPYSFPYLGYFQMVNAADIFVFYDDVQFIKGGWINRNRIIIANTLKYFTIPLIKASPNKNICEIYIDVNSKEYKNILKTIEQAYKKAPYFYDTFQVLENIFNQNNDLISTFAIDSVKQIAAYLNISTKFLTSSVDFNDTHGLERTKRLMQICKKINTDNYINAPGGKELYSKSSFASEGINLHFIKTELPSYKQNIDEFAAGLSIIDILMFNSREEISNMLNSYSLT